MSQIQLGVLIVGLSYWWAVV